MPTLDLGDSFSVNQRIGSAFIMQVVVCLSFFGAESQVFDPD